MMLMEEMSMPIRDLCMELDAPELYERFTMIEKKLMMDREYLRERLLRETENTKSENSKKS